MNGKIERDESFESLKGPTNVFNAVDSACIREFGGRDCTFLAFIIRVSRCGRLL